MDDCRGPVDLEALRGLGRLPELSDLNLARCENLTSVEGLRGG